MSLLSKAWRVFERIEGYLAFFAVILIIGMMFMVTINVIGRKFFGQPLKGAMELSENSLVWFTFLSAAWILKREKHVMVTLVVDRLRQRVQSLLGIITSIIGAVVCLGIVVYGTSVTWDAFQRGIIQIYVLGLPMGPLYTIIPLGSAFLVIRFIRRTYGFWEEYRILAKKEEMRPEELVEI